jgi:hypothetical protein
MAAKRVVLFGELALVFMSVDDALANRVLDTSVHILTRDQPQVATINRRKPQAATPACPNHEADEAQAGRIHFVL